MMKTELIIITVSALILIGCAEHPQVSNHTIRQQCRMEMETARTAIRLRDQGKSKQEMLQTLPPLHPDSTRLLQQMYHIVDEIYAFADLNEIVYATYRFDYCARQLQRQAVPEKFQNILPQLQACQTQFGMQVSKPAMVCVRAVFPKQPKMQSVTNAN